MSNHTRHHYGAAKRIPKYIVGILDQGIWYEAADEFHLTGYSNNDWARSVDDQRSTTRNIFMLGDRAISWC